jgi:chromosome segregation ATPase
VECNQTINELNESKKKYSKKDKELNDLKKEFKKLKKQIETQQSIMNVSSTNYHQCPHCSKVFLNISYLQGHINRRHSELASALLNTNYINTNSINSLNNKFQQQQQQSTSSGLIINELEIIKERLLKAEHELYDERSNNNLASKNKKERHSSIDEQRKLQEELTKTKDTFMRKIHDLKAKNENLEKELEKLRERVGKESHVGWIKDDIDIEKDTVIKQQKEIERLQQLIIIYEKEIEALNFKLKASNGKRKLSDELKKKDETIYDLENRLNQFETNGGSEAQLIHRIQELELVKHLINYQIKLEFINYTFCLRCLRTRK